MELWVICSLSHHCGPGVVPLGSSLLWALSFGPVATLALSPDPLPKLITCSCDDRHIPSMHRYQAIYVLDRLLRPSCGRRSGVMWVALKCGTEFINKVRFPGYSRCSNGKKKSCLGSWTQSLRVLMSTHGKRSQNPDLRQREMTSRGTSFHVVSLPLT